ncbi:hypothetical protein [Aureliella helgolandensis]|uniref:Uncharacterized protein n=1 Tax=Aureliella helgolandensis TaxID=2527968 RepID=A0A518G9M5_9BACT|nr:hypothetical protein [Aureliella helgolandensis]QDV25298.1 hypothetical protein Q31a_36220 [Aureliella helgolandensis]
MKLYVSTDGNCQSVYSETLDLGSVGALDIRRASHVEPTSDGQWIADLSPISGPQLGPFTTRSQALQAEVAWLDAWFHNLHGEFSI